MVSFKGTIILKNGFIATSTSLYAEYYIKLCNPLNGNLKNVVEMKTSSDSYCIAEFSNNRLVSLLRDGLLQIWNLSDSSLIKSFEITCCLKSTRFDHVASHRTNFPTFHTVE
jgi:hypothetical protein